LRAGLLIAKSFARRVNYRGALLVLVIAIVIDGMCCGAMKMHRRKTIQGYAIPVPRYCGRNSFSPVGEKVAAGRMRVAGAEQNSPGFAVAENAESTDFQQPRRAALI
jgi:hypothetical protein